MTRYRSEYIRKPITEKIKYKRKIKIGAKVTVMKKLR